MFDTEEQVSDDEQQVLTLRAYQYQFAERSLQGHNDIILLPTASGKTYVAIKVILDHLNDRELDGKLASYICFCISRVLSLVLTNLYLRVVFFLAFENACLPLSSNYTNVIDSTVYYKTMLCTRLRSSHNVLY